MKNLLNELFCVFVIAPVGAYLIFVVGLFGVPGLLFGYERPSPLCAQVDDGSRTRFEYVIFPFATYACSKHAGILQPYASNLVHWFNEVPGK